MHIYTIMFYRYLTRFLSPSRLLVLFFLITGIHCGTSWQEVIQHDDMRDFHQLRWEQDSTVLVMAGNGDVFTKPLQLHKGKYTIVFRADGNIADSVLPHFVVRVGNYVVKELSIKEKVNSYTVNFELPESVNEPLQFTFDNDFNNSIQDRNVFLYYPIIIKHYQAF